MNQHVEHLRLDCNQFSSAAQLTALSIQNVIGKMELHAGILKIGSARSPPHCLEKTETRFRALRR
jgi:hypothetical protein